MCGCAGEGSNIDLSATCYNNGSVVYSWQFVRDADMLGNAEISYTCTTQQGNTVSAMYLCKLIETANRIILIVLSTTFPQM